jgi:glyoxylase-like metal-dependent hydrolase (beta-lactamase superfamily II)
MDYMSAIFHPLVSGVTIIERGWLNCNQIVLKARDWNVLIDSGYGRHTDATIRYVTEALGGEPLHWLINTHCHSDHMGGNRALRAHYGCRVTIPSGEVKHVVPWTEQSCWSEEMDQYAEEFTFDDTMVVGDSFEGGGLRWRAYAAPGHDMDALMFFASGPRILVTGDALWERGLGFVWPGKSYAADSNPHIQAALAALDVIEKLDPAIVVPGHGAPFSNVSTSLADARGKLAALEQDPIKNARHVAKSLFVFALLDKGEMKVTEVPAYLESVPVYRRLRKEFLSGTNDELATRMINELVVAKALAIENGVVRPTMRA